jgi:MFS family permease
VGVDALPSRKRQPARMRCLMLLRFTCPGCQTKVAAEGRLVGKTVYCPDCRTPFPLRMPEGTAAPQDPPVLTDLAPAADTPLAHFGDSAGIHPEEVGPSTVDNKAAAKAALTALKNELPPVESIYQPSGVTSGTALGFMLLGIPIGGAAGALVGGICAFLVGLVLWGCVALINWIASLGWICWITILVTGLVGFGGAALVFGVAGVITAMTITGMGKAGNNRNAAWPALFSLVGALLATGLSWFLFEQYGKAPLERILGAGPNTLKLVYQITFGIGTLIAMGVALRTAQKEVQSAKFCEDCQQYMETAQLGSHRLGAVKVLARGLREHNIPMAVSAFSGTAGIDGTATLFHCKQCNKGFLEATTVFKVTWKGDDSTEEKTETWLVASAELSADEVERFKPFASGAPSS